MRQESGAIQESEAERRAERVDADFWRTVLGRRSIRRYTAAPVARATLESLLEVAAWAPSAHNRQPWRFCVILERPARETLVEAMSARWRADLAADGLDRATIDARVTLSQRRIVGAGALVIASLCMEEMDLWPDPVRQHAERMMGVQSVAMACQNLLLAAHAQGLGACWMCAPLFAPECVRLALNLPGTWEPQALITLGYPAEVKSKERAPLASRVVWR